MKNWLKKIIKPNKIVYQDDFIKRLRSLVIGEGMLHEENIFQMEYAITNMPQNGNVIEIGIYGGLSTNVILHLLKKHNKTNKLYNVDAWIYEGFKDYTGFLEECIDGRPDLNRNDYSLYLKNQYINGIKFLSADSLPNTIHSTSDDFFIAWNLKQKATDVFGRDIVLGGPISFAYIDGGHSYVQAKKDYLNVMKNLLKGGLILFDDSVLSSNYGSAKLVKELLSEKALKLVDSRLNHLFIKV